MTLVLVACGRIGFDPHGGSSAGSADDAQDIDAVVVTGDGSVAGCAYVQCPMTMTACCMNASTSCVQAGACGGVAFDCSPSTAGSCPKFQRCCTAVDTSTYCLVDNAACGDL